MGRNKSIIRQAQERLLSMAAFGESKHIDKQLHGGKPAPDKIYSSTTMTDYIHAAARFCGWARDTHGCRTLEDARQYTGDYLAHRVDNNLSAWTVRQDAAALGKLYGCATTELGAELPSRNRCDIIKHRNDDYSAGGHYSEANHPDIRDICVSTGLRRCELEQLRPEDVTRDHDGTVRVHVRSGKGGKERIVEALDDKPYMWAQEAAERDSERVVDNIPCRAPIHAYRADFAARMYDRIADPDAHTYQCRGDVSACYDREAMLAVSRALGHERLAVVVTYLRSVRV